MMDSDRDDDDDGRARRRSSDTTLTINLNIRADALVEVLREVIVTLMGNRRELEEMSGNVGALDVDIQQLIADNQQLQQAVASAPTEIATLVAAALAAAVNQGATPAQLQSLADLHTALGGELAQLNAALAGTPPAQPAQPPTPPVQPTPPSPPGS